MKRLVLAIALAYTGLAIAQTPVTTMRPNKWYINNQKLWPGVAGVSYDDSFPSPGIQPQGFDTPVTSGTVLRPANCNQPWTGGDGANAATFTASATGTTTLTVTAVASGTIGVGHQLPDFGLMSRRIISQLSGTTGGVGTYQMNGTLTVGSGTYHSNAFACLRNAGNFRLVIGFTHFDYADPIVFPAGPGKSHLHAFFGNTSTNAYSTNDTNPRTSINIKGRAAADGGTLNRSAYWVPALIYHCPIVFDAGCDYALDGTPIKPSFLALYYKGNHGFGSFANDGSEDSSWSANHDIQSMPAGFRMLAGNPASTADQPGIVNFECRNDAQDADFITGGHIPGTGVGATDACPTLSGSGQPFVKMRVSVDFPTCWNGVDLDSPSHNAHVSVYGTFSGVPQSCPTGWVQIVGVSYQLDYNFSQGGSRYGMAIQGHDPVTGRGKADMKYWRLASDNYADTMPAGYSMHADWFNGWNQTIMDRWVIDCLRPGIDCHDDLAGKDPTNTTTPPSIFRFLKPGREDR